MFEQAVLPVQDKKTFAEVEKALHDAFAPANAAGAKRIAFAHPHPQPPPGVKPAVKGKPPKTQ